MFVFDIETGPLPEEELRQRVTFQEPEPPGAFDERSVKCGNLGPVKAAMKIAEARAEHEARVADWPNVVAWQKAEWWAKVLDKAALSPLTGRILAIGYRDEEESDLDLSGERMLIENFWHRYQVALDLSKIMIGHNIFGFDMPFIVRRSWLLGVYVPSRVFDRGYIEQRTFIDTMRVWGAGTREMISLNDLARALGVGGKPEGVDGSMFASLLETDIEAAKAYLQNDLDMTWAVAERLGVC